MNRTQKRLIKKKWWLIPLWVVFVLLGWFLRVDAANAPELLYCPRYDEKQLQAKEDRENPAERATAPKTTVLPPILERIAYCESGNRQFTASGTVILGIANRSDTGRFQINKFYHASTAQSLGFDIETEEGNTQYALWLYEKEGTQPWLASKHCWDDMQNVQG